MKYIGCVLFVKMPFGRDWGKTFLFQWSIFTRVAGQRGTAGNRKDECLSMRISITIVYCIYPCGNYRLSPNKKTRVDRPWLEIGERNSLARMFASAFTLASLKKKMEGKLQSAFNPTSPIPPCQDQKTTALLQTEVIEVYKSVLLFLKVTKTKPKKTQKELEFFQKTKTSKLFELHVSMVWTYFPSKSSSWLTCA